MSLFQPRRTVEAAAGGMIDPDDDLYRSTGMGYRDLLGFTLTRAQNLCVQMYRSNPLANRIIKIYVAFMAGEGFSVSAANPDVQAIVDEFWSAERNQMDDNHKRFARDKLLFGEGIHPVSVDEMGNTTIGFIDPTNIDRIERSTLNNMILEAVILRPSPGADPQPLKIVRPETDPFDDDAGLLTGDVFAWLHDRIAAASRGTPFLLPIIDWLDAYDQVLWELVERIKAVRAFFWDVEVQGADVSMLEEIKLQWGRTAPRSGSVRYRNEKMTVQAQQPQIGAYEDVAAARYILRHIATGSGLQPHWIGDPEDANRSTAETMDKPVFRALEDVQADWKSNMEAVLRFAVDRKVAKGLLDRVVPVYDEAGQPTEEMMPAHDLIEVTVPAITDDDVTAAAASLAALAGAFIQLDSIAAIDRNTLRMVIRHLLPALGIPADDLPDPEEADDDEIAQATGSMLEEARRTGALARMAETLRGAD